MKSDSTHTPSKIGLLPRLLCGSSPKAWNKLLGEIYRFIPQSWVKYNPSKAAPWRQISACGLRGLQQMFEGFQVSRVIFTMNIILLVTPKEMLSKHPSTVWITLIIIPIMTLIWSEFSKSSDRQLVLTCLIWQLEISAIGDEAAMKRKCFYSLHSEQAVFGMHVLGTQPLTLLIVFMVALGSFFK